LLIFYVLRQLKDPKNYAKNKDQATKSSVQTFINPRLQPWVEREKEEDARL
jgi:hypothetical protein